MRVLKNWTSKEVNTVDIARISVTMSYNPKRSIYEVSTSFYGERISSIDGLRNYVEANDIYDSEVGFYQTLVPEREELRA